jgi:F-type H+-transporting ATPase subunit alpha
MQQLRSSEISELIKQKIESFEAKPEARTEGVIVGLTDGIVRIHGLSDVMQGEMIKFPGDTYGLALNLERDSGTESAARDASWACLSARR